MLNSESLEKLNSVAFDQRKNFENAQADLKIAKIRDSQSKITEK